MAQDGSILETLDDLGESVRRLNRLLANRCVDCGERTALITRCRECGARFAAANEGAPVWPKEVA